MAGLLTPRLAHCLQEALAVARQRARDGIIGCLEQSVCIGPRHLESVALAVVRWPAV
jgi:hypothetical protein